MKDLSDIQARDVTITASDGRSLAGSLFVGEAPKLGILISAGTGFPRRFYRHVAAYFASQGAVVLTFDYRGIGDSNTDDLATSDIDYPHWGQLDMTGALDHLEKEAPGLPLVTFGHSAGGQFVGFMQNQAKVSRHAFACVGTGYWGVHSRRYLPVEWFWWWGYGEYCLRRYGYIPAGGLWGGEALPSQVFRTWRRWGRKRGYLMPDLKAGRYAHQFDQVAAPICAWVISDDPIATSAACADTLSHYPNSDSHAVERAPQQLGARKLGHAGVFRQGNEVFWAQCWAWLADGQLPQDSSPTPKSQ